MWPHTKWGPRMKTTFPSTGPRTCNPRQGGWANAEPAHCSPVAPKLKARWEYALAKPIDTVAFITLTSLSAR